jgi:hypothetical protein
MKVIIDDGGRAAAGYKSRAYDCVTRSIAIATGLPYAQVRADLALVADRERPRRGRKKSSPDAGIRIRTIRRYLKGLGWTWVPTMHIGSGCTVHLKDGELPMGRLIVNVSKHITAVIDGVIHDSHDPTREGTRCVYGYWHRTND